MGFLEAKIRQQRNGLKKKTILTVQPQSEVGFAESQQIL